MYLKYIFLIIILITSISCSSVKKVSHKETNSKDFLFKKTDVRQLVITGKLNSTQSNTGSANFKIEIFEKDTFALSLFGPMGMLLVRLYSTDEEFLIYNAFISEAIQGSPKSSSFKEFLPLPVDFIDLISMMRNETPFPQINYTEYGLNNELSERIFRNDANPDFVEYVVFDLNDKVLKQVQRKSKEGNETANVIFKDYVKFDNYYFPKKIIFDLQKDKTTMSFDCETYLINKSFNKSLKFSLPSGVKVNKI